MKEVVINFDFDMGPIWKDKFDVNTGEISTGITVIDNDDEVRRLNDEASELFESIYSFKAGGGGCSFDSERFEKIKPRLRSLIYKIIKRLDEINDGTYEIVDKTKSIRE